MTQALTGTLFSYGNKGMRSNNPRTANKKKYNACQALAARFEEEGFPIETKFTNAQDIADYFAGERVICLRCGKPYKSLASHITRIHGWTSDDYKEFYGLPWRTGLTCAETKSLKIDNGKRSIEEGSGLWSLSKRERDDARAMAHKARHRPTTIANVNRAKARFVQKNGGEYLQSDFDAILRLMRDGDLTAKEALKSAGKPSMTRFYERTHDDPEFGRRYRETLESLSYAAQVRGQSLGKRFSNECLRLREEGRTVAEISARLGVSVQTVINNTPGFQKPTKTHCVNGHLKVNGRCKICNTESKRRATGALSREESAETLIPAICDRCSGLTMVVRLRGLKRAKFCEPCRSARYKEYHRNYRLKMRGGK